MGAITQRERKDESIGYTAQIRLKQGGKVVYNEVKTFDRRQAAAAWLTKREKELAQPGALETAQQSDPTLGGMVCSKPGRATYERNPSPRSRSCCGKSTALQVLPLSANQLPRRKRNNLDLPHKKLSSPRLRCRP